MNFATVQGADDLVANPTYYHYDINSSLIRMHATAGSPDGTGPTYFRYNAMGYPDRVIWEDGSTTQFFYDSKMQRYILKHGGVNLGCSDRTRRRVEFSGPLKP